MSFCPDSVVTYVSLSTSLRMFMRSESDSWPMMSIIAVHAASGLSTSFEFIDRLERNEKRSDFRTHPTYCLLDISFFSFGDALVKRELSTSAGVVFFFQLEQTSSQCRAENSTSLWNFRSVRARFWSSSLTNIGCFNRSVGTQYSRANPTTYESSFSAASADLLLLLVLNVGLRIQPT